MSPDEVAELTRLSVELSKLLEKIVNYPGSARKRVVPLPPSGIATATVWV